MWLSLIGASTRSTRSRRRWIGSFTFSAPSGVLVAWVDPQERAGNRKLRAMLEEHGFVVEAGTVRDHGSAVAARRYDPCPVSKAA